MIELTVDLPCMSLAQKVDVEVEEMFSAQDDFANVFQLDRVFAGAENEDQMQPAIMVRKSIEEGDGKFDFFFA
jgi:hypothetical protein